MKKTFKQLASAMAVTIFLFIAFASGDDETTKTSKSPSETSKSPSETSKSPSETSKSQTIDGVYTDHNGDFQSTVSINGNRFSWSSTMYGQQQPTSYGIVVSNDIYEETGSVKIGSINPQRGTVSLRTACCGTITCSK